MAPRFADDLDDETAAQQGARYSSFDAIAAAGCSYRQADYWARTGIVEPSREARGSGTQRRYTLDEVVALAVVHEVSGMYSLPFGTVEAVEAGADLVTILPGTRTERARCIPVASVPELLARLDGNASIVVDVRTIRERVTEALETIAA